jgi:hypothetical protein
MASPLERWIEWMDRMGRMDRIMDRMARMVGERVSRKKEGRLCLALFCKDE